MPSEPSSKPLWADRRKAVAAVFLTALLARVGYVALWRGEALVPDSYSYLALADNLAAGKGFSADGIHPSVERPPLYPAFLAATRGVFGTSPLPVKLAQALMDSASAVSVQFLGAALAGPLVGLAAGLVYALHPVFIGSTALLSSEPLFFFWWFPSLALLAWGIERRSAAAFFGSGALLGLSLVTRPPFIFFAPLVLPVLLVRGIPWKRAAVLWLALAAGTSLVLGPWIVRNWVRFHRVIPVMAGGYSALWAGSLPYDPSAEEAYEIAGTLDLKHPDADERFIAEARRNWRAHFWANIAHMPHRFRKFWLSSHSVTFRIETSNAEMVRRGMWPPLLFKLGLLALQLLILGAGVWAAWSLRRAWRYWLLLVLPVAYATLHLTNDWRPSRYHLPALPCFFVLVAWAASARLRPRTVPPERR